MSGYSYILVGISATICFLSSPCHGQDKKSVAEDYIAIYQNYIGGIRGGECPMYPSCSRYGLQAFKQTNFFDAALATSDRLMRCGHDHSRYNLTLQKSGFKLVDLPPNSALPSGLLHRRMSPLFPYGDFSSDDSTKAFIKKLISEGKHREALLEIERETFFNNNLDRELYVNKLICYEALDELEEGLFSYATECPEEFKEDPEILYRIAVIQYKLGNYEIALRESETALMETEDSYDRLRLNNISGLALLQEDNIDLAVESFSRNADVENAKGQSERTLRILEGLKNSKTKSPAVAGIFSAVIPGAGYVYCGHPLTGVSSLIINGLLGYATFSSLQRENYGMALLTGVFSLSFYLGNISGSAKSAKRRNLNNRQNAIRSIESITLK